MRTWNAVCVAFVGLSVAMAACGDSEESTPETASSGGADAGVGGTAGTGVGGSAGQGGGAGSAGKAGNGGTAGSAGSTAGAGGQAGADAGPADANPDSTTNPPIDVCTGVFSHWHLEGDLVDIYGLNHGTTTFPASAGVVQRALHITDNGSASIPDSPSLDVTTGVTISLWIRATALGGRLLDKISSGGSDGYYLDTHNDRLRFGVGDASVSSTQPLPVDEWVHVAARYDGTQLVVYINGEPAGAADYAGSIPTNDLPLVLGTDQAGGHRFSGHIDELSIYDKARAATEMEYVYGAAASDVRLLAAWHGENNFSEAFHVSNTASSTGVTFTAGQIGRGFQLTGAEGSFLEIAHDGTIHPDEIISLEAWVYPTALEGRIFNKATAGGSDGYLLDIVNNKLRMQVGALAVTSADDLQVNSWSHVVGVYRHSTQPMMSSAKVYINGTLAGSVDASASIPQNTLPLRLGADSEGAHRFAGVIDEVRIHNDILSEDSVQARYHESRCK